MCFEKAHLQIFHPSFFQKIIYVADDVITRARPNIPFEAFTIPEHNQFWVLMDVVALADRLVSTTV